MASPHFLRFTRALALGATVVAAGCGSNVQPDAGGDSATNDVSSPSDVASTDSATVDVDECTTCQCEGFGPIDASSGLPVCSAALIRCCAAVGPLPPPELSA
ncbi:MAG: hypothetical protein JNK05_18025 [Myxococcales bacterium]|nr:hypothetical protein [Myxococcales bacterium]